jgi:hypothetical protein
VVVNAWWRVRGQAFWCFGNRPVDLGHCRVLASRRNGRVAFRGVVASFSQSQLVFQVSKVVRILTHGLAITEVRPNPSLERTSTGLALGPRTGQCHHPLRGPSANPAGSAQLKR